MSRFAARLLAAGLSAAVGVVVLIAVLALPDGGHGLGAVVRLELAESGATNPVTAVLLNFRGFDTWLEVGVLLLGVLAALAATRTLHIEPADGRDERTLLSASARAVGLFAVLVSGYLLWRGTSDAGGAFQAGAVGAAAVVLLQVSGVGPAERVSARLAVAVVAISFIAFLGVAAVTGFAAGAPLAYRGEVASMLIVLLELGIAVSTAAALALLFAVVARR